MLISHVSSLGTPRINHDELAVTTSQIFETTCDIWGGHQAAVRDERITADHEQELRSVDIGNRQQELMLE